MSISKALAALFSNDSKPAQVTHSSLASMPTWVLVLFVVGLLWLTHGVLTEQNVHLIFWLALAYIVSDRVVTCVKLMVNGAIKRVEVNAFTRDNQLSGTEAAVLMQRRTVEKTTETASSTST